MENNKKQNKNKNYIIMSICIVLAVVFGVLLGLVYSNRDVIFKNNKDKSILYVVWYKMLFEVL